MSPHLSLPYGRPHNRNPQDGAGSDLETCFGLIAHSYSLRKCVSSRGASGYCSLWEGRASMRRTSSDWRGGRGFGEDSLDVETRRFEGRAEVTGNSADLHALEQEIGDAALGGGKSVDGVHGCGAGTHRRGCVYQEDECGEWGRASGQRGVERGDGQGERGAWFSAVHL